MQEQKMKSKTEKTKLEKDPTNLSRRNAILTTGVGMVAAVGATGASSQTNAEESSTNKNTRNMDGATSLITGGARGIGLASAIALAKEGSNIVLYDVAGDLPGVNYPLATESDLYKAKEKIEVHGVKCIFYKGDVRDRNRMSQVVGQTVEQFGSLDHVVVNAGVTQIGMIEYFTDEEVQTVIDINVTGAVRTVQSVVPIMRKQKSGGITIISSLLGRQGDEWFPIYSATKWAVIGLAKSTALILGQHNATCNAICPTVVKTDLMNNDYVLESMSPQNPTWDGLEDLMTQWRNPLPMGAYEPADIGEIVRYFASDKGKKITGEVFGVTAGLFARNTA